MIYPRLNKERAQLDLQHEFRRQVYVIDDDPDVRRSLHSSLAAAGITGWPFACAQDFLEQVDILAPFPVLLDIRMPGMDGLELLASLRDRHILWPVIMMSAHGDIPVAVRSMRLGAVDFLEKPFKFENLEALLHEAEANLPKATQLTASRLEARRVFQGLSPREKQVIDLLVAGKANKAIGDKLRISARTVEVHRAHALRKLGLKSLAQVAVLKLEAELCPIT